MITPNPPSALARDLGASLAVFLVAVPLCLGIAHASGAPPVAGLLSGIVGGVVVGYLSHSRLSVSGPAAGLTTIVLGAIASLGSYEAFLAAVVLAGLGQLAIAYFRLGSTARLFPNAVIKGMLASIGLILLLKQFPHLIGYDLEGFGSAKFDESLQDQAPGYAGAHGVERNTFTVLFHAFSFIHPGAAAVGLSSLFVLLLWEKTLKKRLPLVPSSLMAVAWGTLLGEILQGLHTFALEADHRISVPAASAGLLRAPDWSALANPQTWGVALTIALVASIETLLSTEALDRLDPQKGWTPPNRELRAQGIGNILCGLIGGIPITAVVVRGTVNLTAGAATKRSAIIHGFMLVVALLLAGPALNRIPLAALAAVLMHAGAKLASPASMRNVWRSGWTQSTPFLATIVAVLLTNLLAGIAVGVCIALALVLKRSYDARGFTLDADDRCTTLRLAPEVNFFHKAQLTRALNQLPEQTRLEIDSRSARAIDPDVIDSLQVFCERAELQGIEVTVLGPLQLRGATQLAGPERKVPALQAAG